MGESRAGMAAKAIDDLIGEVSAPSRMTPEEYVEFLGDLAERIQDRKDAAKAGG